MNAPDFRIQLWVFSATCMAFGGAVVEGQILAGVCALVVMLLSGYRVVVSHYSALPDSTTKHEPCGYVRDIGTGNENWCFYLSNEHVDVDHDYFPRSHRRDK